MSLDSEAMSKLDAHEQQQIHDWTDDGWLRGKHVMTVPHLCKFLKENLLPKLSESASEKSSVAKRGAAKADFGKNLGLLIIKAAEGELNGFDQASAVINALEPFLNPGFRKDSWADPVESASIAAELVIEFAEEAKRPHSRLRCFSEFLSEREKNSELEVKNLQDMQSAMTEFLMKIRTALSLLDRLKRDAGGKKPDGDKNKPEGGNKTKVKAARTYSQAVDDKSANNSNTPPCKTCGENGDNSHHALPKGCPFERDNHPERNKTHATWVGSVAAAKAKAAGFDKLPWQKKLDGSHFDMATSKKNLPGGKKGSKENTDSKSVGN